MPKHLFSVASLIAALVLLVMLNFTTPAGIGPLGVLVFFTTFYILMLGIAEGVVKVGAKMLGKSVGRKGYLYGAVIAFGPIMLLLAQSLGSMSVWTLLLTAVFVLLACFLIAKRS